MKFSIGVLNNIEQRLLSWKVAHWLSRFTQDVKFFLSLLFVYLDRFEWNSVSETLIQCRASLSSVTPDALSKGVYEICLSFLHFSFSLSRVRCSVCAKKWSDCFMKIITFKAVLFSMRWINFCFCLRHFLSDMSGIWYTISARNAKIYGFLEFGEGNNDMYLKPHDVLGVKKTLK